MDSKVLQLMESADPQDRKKAIRMLAQIGGQESLRYLGQIYKRDEDPEVKNLAIQAGKLIKKQEAEDAAVPAPAPVAAKPAQRTPPVQVQQEEPVEEEDEPLEEFHPVNVSASSEKQSKGLMERALDLSMHGEREKAIESIAKAFKINPNLRLDSYYMDLTMDITGLPHDESIRLVTTDEKTRKAKNKQKAKNDGSIANEEVSWDTALIDLATYFVVVAAVMLIGMILVVQLFTAALTTMQACGCNTAEIRSTISFLDSVRGFSIVASILTSLVVGLFSVLALMFQYALIHLISTMILGGDGTYRGLIHRATTPFTIATVVTGVVFIVSLFLLLKPFSDPESLQAYMANSEGPLTAIMPILSLVNMIVGFICLGSVFSGIGKNYEFGSGRGCVAFFLSNIAISVISFACSFVLTSTLFNAMR